MPYQTIEPNKNFSKLPKACFLTEREKNLCEFIQNGYTTKTIALFLSLSPRTVESHIRNIKEKLSCSSKSNLVMLLKQIRLEQQKYDK